MPILTIRHLTRYRYRKPVGLGEHRMMFRPLEGVDQRLIASDLKIRPEPSQLRHVQDVFGNWVSIAEFKARARQLEFLSSVTLDHRPMPAFAGLDGERWIYDPYVAVYSADELPDLQKSIEPGCDDPDGDLERWARSFVSRTGKTSLQRLLADMTGAIYADFHYGKRHERGAQSPLETLSLRTGACRDFAVLMIEAVRRLGLAARFVSGYIHCPPRPGVTTGRLGGGHTHAWVRVYLPACGWVEFDPTNGLVGNADLIRVAITRDPRQATPLHGSWSGDAADFLGMDVEVDVSAEDDAAMLKTPLPSSLEGV